MTIGIVQRERFSLTRRSLESLYASVSSPFDLIYVDAGTPRRARHFLESAAGSHGLRLIQRTHYVSPNHARNLVLATATTPYIVLADNDVLYTRGWLEALLDCAGATGADVITPLICIGMPAHERVHVAGGLTTIVDVGGERRLKEVQNWEGRLRTDVQPDLVREPTELAEFHCVLLRRDLIDRMGLLDESLLSTSEHLDFSLMVRAAGGTIMFEPAAVVTYVPPPPLALTDVPYYTLRWSDGWNLASEQHFHRKWKLRFDDHVVRFGRNHRRLAFRRIRRLMRLTGADRAERFSSRLDAVLLALAERRGAPRTTSNAARWRQRLRLRPSSDEARGSSPGPTGGK